ncbi:TetR/AcrR family transcriptional regulator [Vallitalea sediminicola]
MAKFQRKTKEEREKEIKKAALEVFLRKGYRNTTMEDVISETSLSKGGVYRYFKSPKDIMISIMKDGNNIDNEYFKEISESVTDKKEMCNLLANKAMDKVLNPSPEKKLYLMFVYEILYDEKLEEIFLGFERDTFTQLERLFGDRISFFKEKKEERNRLFMSRLINGMLLTHALFSDKLIFDEHREYLHKMFFDFFNEYL